MESEAQRFELIAGGTLIGLVVYYRFGDIAIVTHTETNPGLEGKGHGSKLAAKTMEWMATQGLRIVPVCGFMAHFLRTHPQYRGMVTPASRVIFNIGSMD